MCSADCLLTSSWDMLYKTDGSTWKFDMDYLFHTTPYAFIGFALPSTIQGQLWPTCDNPGPCPATAATGAAITAATCDNPGPCPATAATGAAITAATCDNPGP
eukprot:328536_1